MSDKYKSDALGTRMKDYEHVTRFYLTKRTPVILRFDGRAFHTYTKLFKKTGAQTPFRSGLHQLMTDTAMVLCENIQGSMIAYTQSDEISILLKDWTTVDTDAWFSNNIIKMCSVGSSIATQAFNARVIDLAKDWQGDKTPTPTATFDCRAFNLPKEEVANYFIWRQQDATRNSVQMLGHHHFSPKQMHGKNNPQVQDMLMLEKGMNWNDLPTWCKRGSCIVRDDTGSWTVDKDIPVFTQDRDYIERHLG
jgi:tRNA(His) guanylyltransferase